jgi:hypothetical protein
MSQVEFILWGPALSQYRVDALINVVIAEAVTCLRISNPISVYRHIARHQSKQLWKFSALFPSVEVYADPQCPSTQDRHQGLVGLYKIYMVPRSCPQDSNKPEIRACVCPTNGLGFHLPAHQRCQSCSKGNSLCERRVHCYWPSVGVVYSNEIGCAICTLLAVLAVLSHMQICLGVHQVL